MNRLPVRLPAEWEPQECVLLSWPHADTDWAYMLDTVTDCFTRLAVAISRCGAKLVIVAPDTEIAKSCLCDKIDQSEIIYIEMPTNDTWARDFGMICTTDGTNIQANDFKFNGWGLKFAACHDNLINRNIKDSGHLSSDVAYANRLGFVLEGGSIESDGRGIILTTSECLLSPNRNGEMSQSEIECYLREAFGATKVLWLDYGALDGDDTDSHIDTLARLLPGGIIAYSGCDRLDDSHYHELKKMHEQLCGFTDCDDRPYSLVELPIPQPIYDDEGMRLPATYANFLIFNGNIIVPTYADAHYDSLAISRLQAALPDYNVIGVDCRALIYQHGSLHCVTMQIAPGVIV